jgi:hypothetical protein
LDVVEVRSVFAIEVCSADGVEVGARVVGEGVTGVDTSSVVLIVGTGIVPPKLPGLVAIIALVLCVSVLTTICTVGAPVGLFDTKLVHSLNQGNSEETLALRWTHSMKSGGMESKNTFAVLSQWLGKEGLTAG